MKRFYHGICFLHVILFLIPAIVFGQVPLKKATLVPLWYPQAQFAGYYVAFEKGIYQRYGIDLSIISDAPDNADKAFLENGDADFAIYWLSTAIRKNAEEKLKLVNIGQIFPGTSIVLISKASEKIAAPAQMNDKKMGIFAGNTAWEIQTFIAQNNLDVRLIKQWNTVDLFLRGGVDVTVANWYNEYHTILNSGYNPDELQAFFLKDYGINFPEDGIYCLSKTYQRDPGLCENFVKASIEGWRYSFDNPDEAVKIIVKYIKRKHLGTNIPHQKWMLEKIKDLVLSGPAPIGVLSKDDFLKTAEALRASRVIQTVPDYESFYKEVTADGEK